MIKMRSIAALLILPFLVNLAHASPSIKSPNVAGTFYTLNPQELAQQIDAFMALASNVTAHVDAQMIVVPHAGYQFSGMVAAHGYKAVAGNAYKTIVVIAPSHYHSFNGAAIWPQGSFKTPLGIVAVDDDFTQALMKASGIVQNNPAVFNQEHALEVQLPFIQRIFPGVRIVPILMGQPDPKSCEQLAVALNHVIGQRQDVLVVISSDMSHYHPYDEANRIDGETLELLKRQEVQNLWEHNLSRQHEMCGFVPVVVGMLLARLRGLDRVEVLKYANSGDTAGDKTRVVGYGALIFNSPTNVLVKPRVQALTAQQQRYLLMFAKDTLDIFVRTGKIIDVTTKEARLLMAEGAFVTLKINGQLRGCIGQIIGQKPLAQTIRDMTIAAASQDLRFSPFRPEELPDIEVEISVLSVPERISGVDQIILGKHGVIITDGKEHQGVFLPQVAIETQWGKEEFLAQLCSQKAGLPADCWKDPTLQIFTFTADIFV